MTYLLVLPEELGWLTRQLQSLSFYLAKVMLVMGFRFLPSLLISTL